MYFKNNHGFFPKYKVSALSVGLYSSSNIESPL